MHQLVVREEGLAYHDRRLDGGAVTEEVPVGSRKRWCNHLFNCERSSQTIIDEVYARGGLCVGRMYVVERGGEGGDLRLSISTIGTSALNT